VAAGDAIEVNHASYQETASRLKEISGEYSSVSVDLGDGAQSLVPSGFEGRTADALLSTIQGGKICQYMSWLAGSLFCDGGKLYQADDCFREVDETCARSNEGMGTGG
jgi:hypothetical protein